MLKLFFNQRKECESMYKLVAIDLDGTLLDQYGEITKNTKKNNKKINRFRH